ncbi:hypothetical protein, partial [Paenibacillus graminis]|uniref:hypothetical protein n=1 Tax=Paenibacillus graminis TaxID=189425 RepID=UPI001EE19D8C
PGLPARGAPTTAFLPLFLALPACRAPTTAFLPLFPALPARGAAAVRYQFERLPAVGHDYRLNPAGLKFHPVDA